MGEVRETIVIDADVDGGVAGLRAVGRGFDQVGDATARSTTAVRRNRTVWQEHATVLRRASGVALLGVVGGMYASIRAAGGLNEQMNKSKVVFRESGGAVNKWSMGLADDFGVSARSALAAAGTFGNMLVPMGIARDRAGEMSMRFVELAGDVASFNDADPTQVLEDLRSGLAGESEPLRKYGVFLNEARIRQEAMNLGLVKGKEDLSAAGKAQAIYSLVLKDTKDAQGDFARTADSAANRERSLKAETDNVAAGIGKGLLPAYRTMLGVLSTVIGFFGRHVTTAKLVGSVIAGLAVGVAALTVSLRLQNAVLQANPIVRVISLIAALVTAFMVAYTSSERFRNIVNGALGAVAGAARAVWSWITQTMVPGIVAAWGRMASVAQAVWQRIRGVIVPVMNVIRNTIALVLAVIRGDWSAAWNALKGIASNAVAAVVGLIRAQIAAVAAAARALGAAAWNGLKAGAAAIAGVGRWILDRIKAAISGVAGAVASTAAQIGNAIIDGIVNAVKAGAGRVAGAVRGIVTNAVKNASGAGVVTKIIGKITGSVVDPVARFRPAGSIADQTNLATAALGRDDSLQDKQVRSRAEGAARDDGVTNPEKIRAAGELAVLQRRRGENAERQGIVSTGLKRVRAALRQLLRKRQGMYARLRKLRPGRARDALLQKIADLNSRIDDLYAQEAGLVAEAADLIAEANELDFDATSLDGEIRSLPDLDPNGGELSSASGGGSAGGSGGASGGFQSPAVNVQQAPDLYLQSAAARYMGGVGPGDVSITFADGALSFLEQFIRVQVNGMTARARTRALAGGRTY